MMKIEGYFFANKSADRSHKYLAPKIISFIQARLRETEVTSVLDFGCGNGSLTAYLADYFPSIKFIGTDPSPLAAKYHDLNKRENVEFIDWEDFIVSGPLDVDIVLSIEVIEHIFLPRDYVRDINKHLGSTGAVIVSTPFHGYWKNLAISIVGGWDKHFTALWDFGHIKFWSPKTLDMLFSEEHFINTKQSHAGRLRPFSKSMIREYIK